MTGTSRGRISLHPRGFGFFTTEDDGPAVSAFVAPPDLNPFLDGDRVSATLIPTDDGRYTATGLSLVRRSRTQLFGEVTFHGKRPFLRVDRLVANTDWPFAEHAAAGLAAGQSVVASIRGGELTAVRTVAPGADLGLERCIVRHEIRSEYPPDVVEAAQAAARSAERAGRRDLRELPTITIDAPVSTDLDDALSVWPAGPDGALRLLVSIADVDAFVVDGSPVDAEARERGTSVYLAGRVLHMLPEPLASDAASLIEAQDRPALTVELRIDAEGEVTAVDLYESLIRSHARLSYESVNEFLLHGRAAHLGAPIVTLLRWLRTAAARLSTVRAARGGVELVREEASITLDEQTREPRGLETRELTDAHRLVERLMVAANEAVADWLIKRGLPGIFRVHDEPTPERVAQLARFARNFGIEPGFAPRLTPRGLAAFEAQLRGPAAPAMQATLARVLGPARYTVHPSPHFGLAAAAYLHFTSPIRRYADLTVHRIVKRYLRGERAMHAGDPALEALAIHLNQKTAIAAKAESERHRMLVARLFAGRIGEKVSGNVVGVEPFGLVVQMLGTGATGTVAIDALAGGPYRVDLAGQALVGPSRRYAVGDSLRATVRGTDEGLGRVELAPVDG